MKQAGVPLPARSKKAGKKGFYDEPYVTCYFCNHILFLDVYQFQFIQTVRHKNALERGARISKELQDRLPPCELCGKLDGFVFGAHDFSKDIEALKRLKEQRKKLEANAVAVIVRYYRKYLLKKYRRARAAARLTNKYLRNRAAVRIGAVARGRLARRQFATEKHLKFLKESHPLLIRHALKIVPGQPRVFWYRRQVELDLVFSNYLKLIERTGQQPPRVIVERNIEMLAERVLQRQHELVTYVQRRFRGFISRRIVAFFCTEIYRLFSREVSKVLRIQRIYRGHYVRMYVVPRLLSERMNEALLKSYRIDAYRKQIQRLKHKAKEGLLVAYKKERAETKTARYLLKVPYQFDSEAPPPSLHQLASTKSLHPYRPEAVLSSAAASGKGADSLFYRSTYGDDIALLRGKATLEADRRITDVKFRNEETDVHRREFIKHRVAEKGPEGFGSRDQPPAVDFVHAKAAGRRNRIRDSSRSYSMHQYFATEMDELKSRAVERIVHPSEEDCFHEKERVEKKRAVVSSQIKAFNEQKRIEIEESRRRQRAMRRGSQYAFPEDMSFRATDWLYQHDDNLLDPS